MCFGWVDYRRLLLPETSHLLESKPDGKIERQHYIDLSVRWKMNSPPHSDNPRMRIFSNLRRLGTRTDEMGKLLDEAFIHGRRSAQG